MAKLNKAQKEALAALLISKAGDLVEFWQEMIEDDPAAEVLQSIDANDAARQLATWLHRLPGDSWSVMLPQVWTKREEGK